MKDVTYIEHSETAHSFVGKPAVDVFAAYTLASGLKLYAQHGIRPSRACTPKAMMSAAARITGKTFRARDYAGAAQAVTEWAQAQRSNIPECNAEEQKS